MVYFAQWLHSNLNIKTLANLNIKTQVNLSITGKALIHKLLSSLLLSEAFISNAQLSVTGIFVQCFPHFNILSGLEEIVLVFHPY